MNIVKFIIKEALLNEQGIQTYYHFTPIDSASQILYYYAVKGSDMEKEQNMEASNMPYNVCFTRTKTINYGYGLHFARNHYPNICCITIDGSYINSRYKVKPYDCLGMDARISDYDADVMVGRQVYAKNHFNGIDAYGEDDEDTPSDGWNETEERMFSNKEYNDIGMKSVSCVDIILDWHGTIDHFKDKLETTRAGIPNDFKGFIRNSLMPVYSYLPNVVDVINQYEDNIGKCMEGSPNVLTYSTYQDFENHKPCRVVQEYKRLAQSLNDLQAVLDDIQDELYDYPMSKQELALLQRIGERIDDIFLTINDI